MHAFASKTLFGSIMRPFFKTWVKYVTVVGLHLRADHSVEAPGVGVEEDDSSETAQLALLLKMAQICLEWNLHHHVIARQDTKVFKMAYCF